MPKISVIMPVYNTQTYLRQAIDSVLAQTFDDFELVIISEYGDSPESRAILEEYSKADSRVVLLYNSHNMGIAMSVNVGIEKAQGSYLARMDSDDISLPNRFQTQVDFLDANPEIDICGSDVLFIDGKGRRIGARDRFPTDSEQIKSDLLFFHCLRHPSVMMRKSALQAHNLRYDETYSTTEDYELWNRACHKVKLANLPDVLLLYRWYNQNATHLKDRGGIENYLRVMDASFQRLGVCFSWQELLYLCPITCRIDLSNMRTVRRTISRCAQRLLEANDAKGLYRPECLRKTLSRRLYWRRHPVRLLIVATVRSLAKRIDRVPSLRRIPVRSIFSMAAYIELHGIHRTMKRLVRLFIKKP